MIKIIFFWNHSESRKSEDGKQAEAYTKTQRYFEGKTNIQIEERDEEEIKLEFWEDNELVKSFLSVVSLDRIVFLFKKYLEKYMDSSFL